MEDPKRTFPGAVLSSMALVLLTYLLPLLAGTGAYPESTTDWDDGYFSVVGAAIGGPWLGAWIMCAAALSTWGQFEAEMSRCAGIGRNCQARLGCHLMHTSGCHTLNPVASWMTWSYHHCTVACRWQ